jgi:hypothetical protein
MNDASILEEPTLEFRYGQRLVDPRDGLSLFGPYDADMPSRPGNVPYGVIGTEAGIAQFRAFAQHISSPIVPDLLSFDPDLWPAFPGFDAAFSCAWSAEPVWAAVVDREQLLKASKLGEAHDRAFAVVEHYLKHISIAKQRDDRVHMVFCVVPEEVYQNCRPLSKVSTHDRTREPLSRDARELISAGQFDFLDTQAVERFSYSVDFRRQLKARSLQYETPVQIVRETTLRLTDNNSNPNERSLTPLADRAWNLATAAYYKAGGKPWRLAVARPGVCYIGLAFRRTDNSGRGNTAACAAQMFLDSGDGIVFKGEHGPWYSERSQDFHLTEEAAYSLLKGVLETYKMLGGQELRQVFLHSRSEINREEYAGYLRAVPQGVTLCGIRVRSEGSDGIKLFRWGTRPVIRGTVWPLGDNSALLWASGFVARQRDYVGGEVPVPLRIDIQHGTADILRVAEDILGLTKLNFNACKFGDNQPVTVGFSDAVGEILVGNREISNAQPQFRYYI